MKWPQSLAALVTTLLVVVAAAPPVAKAEPLTLQSLAGCSEFAAVKDGKCVPCAGLGRPFSQSCYDRFEVTWAIGVPSSRWEVVQTNSALLKAMDKDREDNFNQDDESSNSTIGLSLAFRFSSADFRQHVEKVLIWKRRGECATRHEDYIFWGMWLAGGYRPVANNIHLSNDAHFSDCLAIDKGDYFQVTCAKMLTHGIKMMRKDRAEMSNCDVPAEVEVYGTRIAGPM